MRIITLVTFCRIFQPIFNLHLGHWSSNVSHSSRSRRVTPQEWYGVFFPNMIEDGSWQHSLNLGQYGICSTEVKGHRDILCVCVCIINLQYAATTHKISLPPKLNLTSNRFELSRLRRPHSDISSLYTIYTLDTLLRTRSRRLSISPKFKNYWKYCFN